MNAVQVEQSYYLNWDTLRVKGDAFSNTRTMWINQDTPCKPETEQCRIYSQKVRQEVVSAIRQVGRDRQVQEIRGQDFVSFGWDIVHEDLWENMGISWCKGQEFGLDLTLRLFIPSSDIYQTSILF